MELIVRYTASALIAAALAGVIWYCFCHLGSRRKFFTLDWMKLGMVSYLAGLLQITALRIGLENPGTGRGKLRTKLLQTTRQSMKKGTSTLIYHVGGNMLWFFPLGLGLALIPKRPRLWKAIVYGAMLSCLIEALQYLLGTGVCDVDDVLFNVLGTALGWLIGRLFRGFGDVDENQPDPRASGHRHHRHHRHHHHHHHHHHHTHTSDDQEE